MAALGMAWTGGGSAAAAGGPSRTLIVAGPPGTRLDKWADVITPVISRGLSSTSSLSRQNIGGIDGVTGANQFEVRAEPDGATALLVPGAAVLSWLLGEMRAHFDPTRWVPVWAGMGSATLVSHTGLAEGRRLRVAAENPVGPELSVLLALDLLGIVATPVAPQSADSFWLYGPDLLGSLRRAAKSGLRPVLSLGRVGPEGLIDRDPLMPDVPTALELLKGRDGEDLVKALRATGLANQLDFALMLPALTPAASVALWRSVCTPLFQDPDVIMEAEQNGTHLVSTTAVASHLGSIAADPAPVLALRRWIASRRDLQPT